MANKHCVILSSNLTLEATSKAVLSCLRRGALHLFKVSRHNIVQGKVSRIGLVGKAHLDSLRVYRIKVYIQFTQTLMDREIFQLLLFHALTKISGYTFFSCDPQAFESTQEGQEGIWGVEHRFQYFSEEKNIHVTTFSQLSGQNMALLISEQLRIL